MSSSSVAILSRRAKKVPGAADYIAWHSEEEGAWAQQVDGAHAIINLAGSPGRREALERRVQAPDPRLARDRDTRAGARDRGGERERPRVLINGSAIGYYGARDATPLDEGAAPGDDFLAGRGARLGGRGEGSGGARRPHGADPYRSRPRQR